MSDSPPVDPVVEPPVPQPEPPSPPLAEPPAAEPPSPDAPPASEPPAPVPTARAKPSLQEKFERMSAARRAAEAERDAALARLAELTSPPAAPTAPAAPELPPRPVRDAFNNPDDYEAALVEWASEKAARKVSGEAKQTEEQRRADEASAAQRAAAQSEAAAIQREWNERRSKFMAEKPDYIEVAEAQPDEGGPTINSVMADAIMLADNGPEIAYWLGQHPEESERIAKLTRGVFPAGHPAAGQPMPDILRQSLEIGRIAASLRAPAVTPPRSPAPITPLRAVAATAASKNPDEMTIDEYREWRKSGGSAIIRH